MSELRNRLERFVAEREGECCDADVKRRIDEAVELRETAALDSGRRDVEVFSALANETRYELLRVLAAAPRELCVCEFGPLFDVSESTVSQGLSALVDAGLITREPRGRWRFYETTDRGERIANFMDDLEAADGV